MIVTKIRRIRGRKPRYRIEFDNAPSLEVSDSIIGRFGLCTGDELDEQKRSALVAAEAETQAKNIAINYVSYRPRSSKETEQHLIKKGFDETIAHQTVERLKELRMIDDLEFARMFVRDRIRRNKSGTAVIRQQLIQKGIARAAADMICSELLSDEQQKKAALETAQKYSQRFMRPRKKNLPHNELLKQKKRLFDFLMRRGFSADLTRQTLETIFSKD